MQEIRNGATSSHARPCRKWLRMGLAVTIVALWFLVFTSLYFGEKMGRWYVLQRCYKTQTDYDIRDHDAIIPRTGEYTFSVERAVMGAPQGGMIARLTLTPTEGNMRSQVVIDIPLKEGEAEQDLKRVELAAGRYEYLLRFVPPEQPMETVPGAAPQLSRSSPLMVLLWLNLRYDWLLERIYWSFVFYLELCAAIISTAIFLRMRWHDYRKD